MMLQCNSNGATDIEASNAVLKGQPSRKPEGVKLSDIPNERVKPTTTVFLATFGALLSALSMGLALGYTAPAFVDMEKDNQNPILDMDNDNRERQKSLIGSTMAVGALLAALANEPCNKLFGRRIPLIVCGLPFVIGWLLLALADRVTMLVLGRLLIGACCGIACGTAPTYVVEIAPPQIRGALGTGFQLMVVIGNLLASVFGIFLPWRALAAWSLIPAVVMSIIMFFMPESPNWLLNKNRNADAEQALKRFRASPIEIELKNMAEARTSQGNSEYSCDMITSREFIEPLLFALGLMFFQQFTGINAVLMYQSDIFKKASPDSDAMMSTVWVCLAQVIATIVCSSLVDRLGRKILLFVSGLGAMITLFVLGLYSHMAMDNKTFQQDYAFLPLISLMTFITFFSFGFGPIPWMLIPELSTSRVRSLVASFGACFAWSGCYIVTASMKPLISLVGDAWTYWMLAIVCACSCLFVVILPNKAAED